VATMVRNHTDWMPDLPDAEKKRHSWGLGWRIGDRGLCGDLVSMKTFGHGGATGTATWMDPDSGVSFVLLTNQAEAANVLRSRVSNVVASAVM